MFIAKCFGNKNVTCCPTPIPLASFDVSAENVTNPRLFPFQ